MTRALDVTEAVWPLVLASLAHTVTYVVQPTAPVVWPLYLAAVAASAWRAGLLGGMLTTGMSALLAARYILPRRPPVLTTVDAWASVGVFLITGSALSLMIARMRQSRRTTEMQTQELTAALEAQRRSEQHLLRSETRLASIIGSAMDAIITVDGADRIMLFNTAAERMFGVSSSEALGQPLDRFLHGPRVSGTVLNVAEAQTAMRADGEFPVETAISEIEYNGERIFTVILRDLTERRKAEVALQRSEDQLRQAQKMEAVGQLAGGIAHDFNNILTVISTSSEFLLQEIPKGGTAEQDTMEIRKATARASDLTRQLLAFSRKQVLRPRPLNLRLIVQDMAPMLRRVIREDIQLEVRGDPEVPTILADPSQIEQVILNLVVNARDAMPDGGQLVIQVDHVFEDGTDGAPRGEYSMLTVRDTGMGMDEATRRRIFEPFFTTKARGSGTGLGLATVYGVVKQSDGWITVASAPHEGTTFRVFFPKAAERERPEPETVPCPEPPTGHQRLLLVEDEPAVRQVVSRLLRNYGYEVLEAGNGVEALEVLEGHGMGVDLVLTDVVMPEMGGRQLGQEVAERWPDLPVLYMSGYTDDEVLRREVRNHYWLFLQKPFAPEALIQQVQRMLHGPVLP